MSTRKIRERKLVGPGVRSRLRTASLVATVLGLSACSQGDSGLVMPRGQASTQAPSPAQIVLTPAQVDLSVGQSQGVQASVLDAEGNVIPGARVTWRTTDETVADVSDEGRVDAVHGGQTWVTAEAGPVTVAATVEVSSVSEDLEILALAEGNGQSGPVGEKLLQSVKVRVTDGVGSPVVGRSVRWSVLAGGGYVRAVTGTTDSQGFAAADWTMGNTQGRARARAEVGVGAVFFDATAVQGVVAAVRVTPSSSQVSVGVGRQFNALATDRFGSAVTGVEFTWSSSNGTVASVSASGMVTGLGDGSAQIRAVTNGVTGVATLTVASSAPPPTKPDSVRDLRAVTVTDQSVTLRWTQVKDGTGSPANYAIRYGTPTISWGTASATETLVLGTDIGAPMDTLIPGLVPGTIYQFQIVAYRGVPDVDAVFGPISRVASASTTALPAAVASVRASAPALSFTALGDVTQLSATARDASGSPIPGVTFQWQSLTPVIASVDASGRVVANAVGSGRITVMAACCVPADTVLVNITQAPARVTVAPSQVILEEGQTGSLVAAVSDRNGRSILGAPVSYSSGDRSIATVDAVGRVKGEREGSTQLRATSGTAVGTSNATILPPGTPGSWPNEPAGFTKLSERSFSDAREASWWAVGDVRIVADPTAPRGGKVAQIVFPVGLKGGASGGNTGPQRFPDGVREVYIAMWHKISDSWQHHSSGQNKVLYMTDRTYGGNGDPGVLGVFGPGGNPDETNLRYMLFVQGPLIARNLDENRGSVRVVRGDWNLVEVHLVMNSSPSAKDGEGHVWVNGTKTLEYTNLQWSDQSRWWTVVKWGPIWGGIGGVVTSEMYQAMDHFYISGRSY